MNDKNKIIRTTDPEVIRRTEKNRSSDYERRRRKLREAIYLTDQEFEIQHDKYLKGRSKEEINREYRIQTARFKEQWLDSEQSTQIRLHQILSNGLWEGSRCFILGGGTSLADFDYSLLRGEKIIAVNRAYEVCPFADIMLSMDSRYYKWIMSGTLGEEVKNKLRDFKGLKIWVDTIGYPYKNVITIKAIERLGLSWDLSEGIYHGNNSGYSALQLAIALKASPIYLLGFDFYYDGDKSHWHNGYPLKTSEKKTRGHAGDFVYLSKELTIMENGIKIINLNPKSALTCFPRMRQEEIEYHVSNHHH